MKDSYEIEKPSSDLNYLTIGIKYIVLFIVLFLASWIAIPLFIANGRATRINPVTEFLAENAFLFSILISLSVVVWFIYRIRKKYTLGEVFKIDFNDSDQILNIKTVNLANNQEKNNYYNYKNLSYKFYNSKDALFGKQRILHILNNGKTVHEINFDRTAWCRNERIDKLIEKIKTGYNNV
ncbi:hypothetical protein [Ichthyenterobacterium magnum]|uniref:Uncharacterized protein n=1 Tax=Ichthyenterobacterium magnum TaxID=1230530 RepID=A0A420DCQ6_9FLAO|nr:hypothetical protein [Ichthyenterobacterium magnum]RKE89075.1 hypothetical protein BXY80_2796 [Ichthyenterobacterium magnum]